MVHPWRQDEENFDGDVENRPKPEAKTGQQILDIVNALPPIIPGKTQAGPVEGM